MSNLLQFRVYVGTYAKYNEGSLFGAWLDLSEYGDQAEFYQACYELHHDEEDPELMFQDWENIPQGLISECSLEEHVFPYLQALAEMDQERAEAFEIYCTSITGFPAKGESIDDRLETFNEHYQGYFGGNGTDAQEAFAYYLVEETGLLAGVAEVITRYFDYESYGRDLFLDGYSEIDGHVFLDR